MNKFTNAIMEQSVLSCLISKSDSQVSRELFDEVSEDDFSVLSNKYIFRFLRRMSEKRLGIDVLTLAEKLDEAGKLSSVGGYDYLSEIASMYTGDHVVKSHALKLSELKSKRNLISLANKLNAMVNENTPTQDVIFQMEQDLKDISISNSGKQVLHIKEACGNWLDELDKRAKSGGGITGLSTGFDQIDDRLCGIGSESLVTVVGRPSHGKTLWTQAITQNVGVDQGKGVLFFSMEMADHELYERFVSGVGNVPSQELRTARFGNETLGRIDTAVNHLTDSNIHYTCEPTQSLGQIRAKVRRHKNADDSLSLVVIDYLGFIELEKADRHDIAIGKVTRGLKQLAKEVKVPIILICQASRNLDKATRPTMSDIKDSSSIEADSDVVIFVHRQEVADPETELKGVTEIIIAKDRHNGGNGTVFMSKTNGSFKELSAEEMGRLQILEDIRLNPKKEKVGM